VNFHKNVNFLKKKKKKKKECHSWHQDQLSHHDKKDKDFEATITVEPPWQLDNFDDENGVIKKIERKEALKTPWKLDVDSDAERRNKVPHKLPYVPPWQLDQQNDYIKEKTNRKQYSNRQENDSHRAHVESKAKHVESKDKHVESTHNIQKVYQIQIRTHTHTQIYIERPFQNVFFCFFFVFIFSTFLLSYLYFNIKWYNVEHGGVSLESCQQIEVHSTMAARSNEFLRKRKVDKKEARSHTTK